MARVSSGLSHDGLAAAAGTSRQHLIKLEHGQHKPGADLVARIAKATGKPVSYFMADGDEDEEESLPLLEDALGEALGALLRRMIRDEVSA